MKGLPVDYTIEKIFNVIKDEVTLSKDVINFIVDFQSKTIREGIENGDDIHIKYIGSFKFNHKRAFKLEQAGFNPSIKTEQEIVKVEGRKSWKLKELKRIVFK